MKTRTVVAIACANLLTSTAVLAQEPAQPPPAAPAADVATPAPAVKPVKETKQASAYVASWSLRGMSPANFVRLDNSIGQSTLKGVSAVDNVSVLGAGLKLNDSFGISAKWGVNQYEPSNAPATTAFTNASLSGSYATDISRYFRFAGSMGVSAPIGSGGGNSPDPNVSAAQSAGVYTRAAMDNLLFTPNEIGVPVTADVAFHYRRFTAQVGAAIAPLARVKGEEKLPDPVRLPATAGLMAGYFVLPRLSVASELRYWRMLSNPVAVQKDPALRDNLSFAVGGRAYLALSEKVSFRPGASWGMGMEGKIAEKHYQFVQIDFPVVF